MLVNESLRDVSPLAACHWNLHRQASGIPRHADEHRERITFPLLVIRAPPEKTEQTRSLPHNLEVHCFADLCQPAVTLFSSQPSPRTATVVTFDVPAEHMRRVSNELWQDAAFAVNLVPELFLHHRHRFW